MDGHHRMCRTPRIASSRYAAPALPDVAGRTIAGTHQPDGLALVGHRLVGGEPVPAVESTARYAHLARDTEKSSAAKVGGSIEADIMPCETGAEVLAGARQLAEERASSRSTQTVDES